MSYLIVEGGKKLHGTIQNQPNKNSAIAILCACLMVRGTTTLSDVPDIEDVHRIMELLTSIGVKIKKIGAGMFSVDTSGELDMASLNQEAASEVRASVFLWGALAARATNYRMNKSGGCHLGARTVRPHWYALEKFGVRVTSTEQHYEVRNQKPLHAASVVMYESGDTPTENAVTAAALAPGRSTIKMASANYMVQDLCCFLVRAGAKISGIGTTTLVIEGVKELRPVRDYPIMPDPVVAMTFISAAITTGSHLTVANCPLEFLELELCKLEVMGQKYALKRQRLSKNKHFTIVDIEIFPSKLLALPDKIYGRPFPGLNIDNLPLFVPILTQVKGRTLVHDWVYENRATYFLELQKLGARVTLIDPHRVWVEGPTKLKPNELVCPPALRPAVSVLICMLAAKGRSVLRNIYEIDRGYENVYAVLNKAGAKIKVVAD